MSGKVGLVDFQKTKAMMVVIELFVSSNFLGMIIMLDLMQ
jgi:hypothetical protein